LAVVVHKLVEAVDTLHVFHDTEGEVGGDPIGLVHVGSDGAHEVVNLVLTALSTAVEVLASKLGGVDREFVCIMPVLDVLDETLGRNVVIMNGNAVKSAASIARSQERVHPSLTVRVGRGGRGDESVTLVLERFNVLLPEASTVRRRHVRLTRLVRLVEAQNHVGVTLHDLRLEIINLVITPELRNGCEAEGPGEVRDLRAPGINGRFLAGIEVLQRGVVTIGPGKADLARDTTARRGRRSGAGARRLGGSRRGRSALVAAVVAVLVAVLVVVIIVVVRRASAACGLGGGGRNGRFGLVLATFRVGRSVTLLLSQGVVSMGDVTDYVVPSRQSID